MLIEMERLGIVTVTGDRFEYADTSDRARHESAITPSQRRALHATFAGVLAEPRHREQRAEHLAAAAVGPNDDVSIALAALADEATARGDAAGAGRLFVRAGEFASDTEVRARYLLLAGDGFWNAGDYEESRHAFDAALIGSTDPVLRADIAMQLGQLDMYQRGPRHSRDLFAAAAAAVEADDVDRAAMLLVHAASTVTLSSDVIGTLTFARRATEMASRGSGSSVIPAALMTGFISLQHGDTAEFEDVFPMLSDIADELKDTNLAEADLFLQLVGMLHVYTERWSDGRAYLETVAHRAGRRSRTATAALATATLSELCWRSGQWDEAWHLATSPLVTEVTLTGARLWLSAFTAHLDAACGRADECRTRARASLAESEPMGFGTAIIWAHHALGLLELGLGHPVAAAVHLDRVDAICTAHQMFDPSTVWWQADHVEALIRSGRRHEAVKALSRFASAAAASPAVWPKATSARCAALLAPDPEPWFDTAFGHHQRLSSPFELARTMLCRAERRIASGSVLDAAADLDEACAIFLSLGATPWLTQARALRGSIETEAVGSAEELLTPAERRVASAVAQAMTNREVAATLYVSEKTVEFHLRNIYRKLGVRSRTQLVRRLTSG
jgi:DNA-binding CsgD family transcriptional regulator